MAAQLVESLSGDFESSDLKDEYQIQLQTLIDAKLEQGESFDTETTFGREPVDDDADVIDLMEALKRSIDKRKGSAAESDDGPDESSTEAGPLAKKSGVKKAPAKTAAKRAGKKSSGKTPIKKTG